MPYDSLTLRAVTEDLRAHLLGGRVDKVVQPADLEVALLLRAESANHWLLLSAHAQHARVQRTLQKQSGAYREPSAFVMLLRKYLEGARLRDVSQQAVDRVLQLTFHGAAGETVLIAEVMGKYSNIILADDDMVVLGAVKHVRAEENRVRVVLPHHPYLLPPRPMQPPPHQGRPKLDPLHSAGGDLTAALAIFDDATLLWKALLDLVDGLSPMAAREVVYRTSGGVDTVLGDHRDLDTAMRLLAEVRDLYSPRRGSPSALWQQTKLVEWAAFPIRQYAVEPRRYEDVMALLDQVYAARAQSDALAGQRGPLVQQIETLRKSLRRKIASLEASLTSPEALDALRTQGEMVLAYQHSIAQGQRELAIPELALIVALDPDLTPVENAQRLFKRYQKARDAAVVVPALLEGARQDLAYLDQLAVHAAQAADPAALAAVRDELREVLPAQSSTKGKQVKRQDQRGPHKGMKQRPGVLPLRVRAADGTEILIGRSARQNEALTFSMAGPRDIWLHARQIPGAHVIVRTNGHSPAQETLQQAAALAAYYSQARESTVVPVDYTAVRNVRRIKGGKPGMVHYAGESTLTVRPAG
ncbi:MAG TPA: NFACT family protein [Chloroflexota bacterium]|nr:NFACT family protein [Chloroflexota bacterium]